VRRIEAEVWRSRSCTVISRRKWLRCELVAVVLSESTATFRSAIADSRPGSATQFAFLGQHHRGDGGERLS